MGRQAHGLLLLGAGVGIFAASRSLVARRRGRAASSRWPRRWRLVRAMLEKNPGTKGLGTIAAARRRSAIRLEGRLETAGCSRRSGSVGGLRVVKGDRRAAPCLPQAVHAGRRRCESSRLARPSGAHRSSGGERSAYPGSKIPSSSGSEITSKRIQAGEGADHDWQAIIRIVDELVGDGVPPSNREIRELLLARDRRASRSR